MQVNSSLCHSGVSSHARIMNICYSNLHNPQQYKRQYRLPHSFLPHPKALSGIDNRTTCPLLSQTSQQAPGRPLPIWVAVAAAVLLQSQVLWAGCATGAELIESNLGNEGNIPSELSAAGEAAGPRLSSLVSGTNKKQIESCTRRCVPTCTRGGEGAPGLGPISVRKEIVVFKDGFRSRQYCLSECAQVCSLISKQADSSSSTSNNAQQQQQQQQRSTAAAVQ